MIKNNFKKRFITSLALLTLIILIFMYEVILLFSIIIFGSISLIEFFSISKKINRKKTHQFFWNLLFVFYVFIFSFFFFFFSNFEHLKIILFIFLLGCISSDLGGYIIGKIFKGPKLTKISPNKTISGSLGSIFFSIIVVSFLFYLITNNLNLSIIVISITNSLGCQLGDLLFSFLKRKAKVKDTGNFLPGHGGVLDRLDGIYLGVPISFVTLILLN